MMKIGWGIVDELDYSKIFGPFSTIATRAMRETVTDSS